MKITKIGKKVIIVYLVITVIISLFAQYLINGVDHNFINGIIWRELSTIMVTLLYLKLTRHGRSVREAIFSI